MKKFLIGGAVLAALAAGVLVFTRARQGARDTWDDDSLTAGGPR